MASFVRFLPCLLILAGCMAPTPPDTAYDGNYVGAYVRTRGGDTCGPANEPVSVSLRGGSFHYGVPATRSDIGNTLVPVDARLSAGGRLSGQTLYPADNPFSRNEIQLAWATVFGDVTNGRMEANASSLNCGRHLSLLKDQTVGRG